MNRSKNRRRKSSNSLAMVPVMLAAIVAFPLAGLAVLFAGMTF